MGVFEHLRGTVSKKDLKALVWEEWIALVRRSPGMQGHGGKQEGSVGQGSGSVAPAFQPTNAWEAWVAEQTTITRQIDFIVIKAVERYVIPKLQSEELDLQAFEHETPERDIGVWEVRGACATARLFSSWFTACTGARGSCFHDITSRDPHAGKKGDLTLQQPAGEQVCLSHTGLPRLPWRGHTTPSVMSLV